MNESDVRARVRPYIDLAIPEADLFVMRLEDRLGWRLWLSGRGTDANAVTLVSDVLWASPSALHARLTNFVESYLACVRTPPEKRAPWPDAEGTA